MAENSSHPLCGWSLTHDGSACSIFDTRKAQREFADTNSSEGYPIFSVSNFEDRSRDRKKKKKSFLWKRTGAEHHKSHFVTRGGQNHFA
jgi:hypothetical protein